MECGRPSFIKGKLINDSAYRPALFPLFSYATEIFASGFPRPAGDTGVINSVALSTRQASLEYSRSDAISLLGAVGQVSVVGGPSTAPPFGETGPCAHRGATAGNVARDPIDREPKRGIRREGGERGE